MDREAAVFEAIRALTYSEMLTFAAQLRDTASLNEFDHEDAYQWARVLQGALDAFSDREADL